MRIGFDGKRATHNFRGLGNYSRGIIEGLSSFAPEHELFLYTPNFDDQRAINWIIKHPDLKVIKPEGEFLKFFPSMWRSFLLEGNINKHKIDIYHGLSHEIPKVSKNKKFKTVVTIHDLIFMRYPEYFPWIDRKVYYQKFKYSADNADLVIAICEQTKKDLINLLNIDERKIRVHYQSASPIFNEIKSQNEIAHFKKNHNLIRPYILNVGAFEERKNQKNVVEAFSKISKNFDIDLVFIGTGKKYLHEVQELVKLKNLDSRVHFFNNFPFHSLPLVYQGAELLFFPSIFEGFGIPLVEALFSNIPIITSEGSCFLESAGPQSLYIDPLSVQSMADALNRIIGNKELKNSMINLGVEFSKRFTLENSTNELLKLYTQLN